MVYDSWAAQKAATRVDSIMDAVAMPLLGILTL
jgi:hypothetical protein